MIKLPELGYSYDALEPYIDAQTMEIHHSKHHQAYVDNLNKALKEVEGKPAEDYANCCVVKLIKDIDGIKAPDAIKTQIRNNGGGHINHSMFWKMIGPNKGGEPKGKVKEAIDKKFGSFENFKKEFTDAATKRFGSGWAWLVIDENKNLEIISTPNQDNPVSLGKNAILGIDVWEHAYYLKYQNKRPAYIEAFFNVINWDEVERLYDLGNKEVHECHIEFKK